MKRNSLIFSILTMVLCASLIAGSSFALFTSESKVNVAVTAGTVDVEASISDLELYSPTAIDLNGVITDDKNAATTTFANGGTATLEDGTLTLTNITPGDKVKFTIGIANKSNVSIKYRTILSCDDEGLLNALKINIGGAEVVGESAWTALKANGTIESLPCSVELPATVGNAYQNKGCTITFKIEAVQGNAETAILVYDQDTLVAALAVGGEIKVIDNIEINQQLVIEKGVKVALDMNGYTVSLVDGASDACDPMLKVKNGASLTIDGDGTIDLGANPGFSFAYPFGDITINSGTFKIDSSLSKYGSFFVGISGGKGKLVINGGYFDGGYYVEGDCFNNCRNLLNGSWGQYIRVYGGTFVGQNPAWGDEGMAFLCPHCTHVSGKGYCQTLFLEGQSREDTELPAGYTITEGTTLDGRPTYTVTYTAP